MKLMYLTQIYIYILYWIAVLLRYVFYSEYRIEIFFVGSGSRYQKLWFRPCNNQNCYKYRFLRNKLNKNSCIFWYDQKYSFLPSKCFYFYENVDDSICYALLREAAKKSFLMARPLRKKNIIWCSKKNPKKMCPLS